jgi:hypothetical protein
LTAEPVNAPKNATQQHSLVIFSETSPSAPVSMRSAQNRRRRSGVLASLAARRRRVSQCTGRDGGTRGVSVDTRVKTERGRAGDSVTDKHTRRTGFGTWYADHWHYPCSRHVVPLACSPGELPEDQCLHSQFHSAFALLNFLLPRSRSKSHQLTSSTSSNSCNSTFCGA